MVNAQIFSKTPLQQDMLATFKRSNEHGNNSEHKNAASVMQRLSV
jgi:hypothetical protein